MPPGVHHAILGDSLDASRGRACGFAARERATRRESFGSGAAQMVVQSVVKRSRRKVSINDECSPGEHGESQGYEVDFMTLNGDSAVVIVHFWTY
jgi:hypothetical protein